MAERTARNARSRASAEERLQFRTRLILTTMLVSVVCLIVAGLTLASIEVLSYRTQSLERATTLAEMVAANSEGALSFDDPDAARQTLATLAKDPNVQRALLYRLDQPEPFAAFIRSDQIDPAPKLDAVGSFAELGLRTLSVARPVERAGEVIGQVRLEVELAHQAALLRRLLLVFITLLGVTALLAWWLSARLHRSITEPVAALLDVVRAIERTGNMELRSRAHGAKELVELSQAVNSMLDEIEREHRERERAQSALEELTEQLEARVAQRTSELAEKNAELLALLERLRQTQNQLIESEKMAALGGLVAGVAHEINTPIGICVTVASHLEQRARELSDELASGLKRSTLERYLQEVEQGHPILANNLQRAANLVRSFKLVAVDQSSEQRRPFDAAEYFTDVLNSLAHEFKRSRINAVVEIEEKIELQSYPGVYAQILTNLCMNAIIHAYPDGGGTLRISGWREQDQFVFAVQDQGVGMSEAVRLHVFEPFFTTRRGSGGSGLGLHIVYNQVTVQLGGTITCTSAPGAGARFEIRVPIESPMPKAAPESAKGRRVTTDRALLG